jgi:hypothetical protein
VGPTYQCQFLRPLALSIPLPGGPSLSVSILSRSCPFSLTAWWVRPVSADRPFASSLSLARRPHLSATSPSLTSRSRSPPGRAHDVRFPATPPHIRPLFWIPHPLAHSPRSVAPSTNTLAPLSRTTRTPVELRHGQLSIPWPPLSFSHVCYLGELRLLASNARHPLGCP